MYVIIMKYFMTRQQFLSSDIPVRVLGNDTVMVGAYMCSGAAKSYDFLRTIWIIVISVI